MENGTAPFGVTALWNQGDIVTHATLVILVLMSVASWSVIAVKAVEQSLLLRQGRLAGRLFWAARSVEDALAALAPGSAFRALAQAGIEADRLYRSGAVDGMDRHGWVSLALRRAARRSLAPLQGGLTLLASVASTAPFVGLFGTVWGIYHALTAIGVSGQASIDKVAGPVGEALIMTAIGLVVAVPAVLGYNLLGRRNRKAAEAVQGFTGDLHAMLLGGTWAGGGERAGWPRLLERTA